MKILFYVEPEKDYTLFRVLKIKGSRKNSIWCNDTDKVYFKHLSAGYIGFGKFKSRRMNKYKE